VRKIYVNYESRDKLVCKPYTIKFQPEQQFSSRYLDPNREVIRRVDIHTIPKPVLLYIHCYRKY